MADLSIKATGIDELVTALGSTAPDALNKGITDALEQLRGDILDKTTNLCPVDTGALKASIDVTVNDTELTATASEDYASYVDKGTSKMSAQPFFEDPINQLIDAFHQQLNDKINDALKSISG